MKKIIFFILGLMFSTVANAQRWVPFIRVPDQQQQMELQELNIDVQIMGNIATTTYDMVFFNPNYRTLEGEIIFPMSENQTVVSMALDIDGKMRSASAVDKDDARRIFEEQVRRNIDPALVEKVSGNQYRMRIYPFNPQGTRQIQITTEENLKIKNNEMPLSIPLTYNKKLNHFGVSINVVQDISEMPKVKTDFENFEFIRKNQHLTASFEKKDYLLNNSLDFTLPAPKKEIVYTGSDNGKNYFYSNINVKKAEKNKTLPKKIAVVWDISSSGNDRNLKKEKDLLNSYLKKIKNADVDLITFNIEQSKSSSFKIKKGNTTSLLKAIDALPYDGATYLDKVDLSTIKADEILLFTDGIATIGESVIKPIKTPVYAITSSDKGEFSMLSNMANKTLARLINLQKLSVQEALKQLTQKPLRLIAYKTDTAHDIYPLPSAVVSEDFTFTGIYDGKETEIELQFGYDEKNITEKKKVKIGTVQENTLIPRQWAAHKARELELDAKNNREAIVQLGKDFSILTEYTSLLVLDRLDDYLRYKVAPKDPDLLEKYNLYVSLNEQKSKYAQEKEKRRALIDTIRIANQIKKWWEKDFRQEPPQAPNEPWNFEMDPEKLDNKYIFDENGRMMGSIDENGNIYDADGSMIGRWKGYDSKDYLSNPPKEEQKEVKIKLKEWSPNTPYIKELRKVKDADLYSTYLKLRKEYQDMPAFFFDVAEEFTKRNMADKATLILSNLLEMQTDNVELLRVAAHTLQHYEQYQMAEILFKKIIEMRSEEPQGYRDLAILYEDMKQNQKALDQYMFILSKKWNDFNDIKAEVFVDMNGLISRDEKLNTRDVSPNLIFNMPIDLRITMGWSSRDKRVGLRVIDPYKKTARHEENENGAKHMSIGYRWSWGPESYMIKKAIEGRYHIYANDYYRDDRQNVVLPVFAWVDVYANFGQENQEHGHLLVRMDEVTNQDLGSIDFEVNSCSENTPLWYINNCTSCNDTRKLFISEEKCNLCPNRKMFGDFCIQICSEDKPMQSSVGNCYACNNEKALHLTEEECKKCPNREMKFGYCVLNTYNCPDEKPLREGVVTCQSCDYEKSMIVSAEDCAKCSNREMVGKYCALKQCPKEKPIQGPNGVCYDCNEQSSLIISPEDCAKCHNRQMVGKYCVRKTCSKDKPLQDKDGICKPCSFDGFFPTDKEECDKCPNRTFVGKDVLNEGLNGLYRIDGPFTGLCKLNCSADKPLQDKYGNCNSCDTDQSIETTAERCAKCPNREFDDGKCVKKTCFNDKDIEDTQGACYACDYKGKIFTYKKECDKCPNRYMLDSSALKGYCVTDCNEKNQIHDEYGYCRDCDDQSSINTDEKTCKQCPNRIYKDKRCVLPCPKEKPLMDKWGSCYACDEESDIHTDEISCGVCPNRRQFGEYCKIACDKYEPMQDVENNGRCYDCDYEDGLSIPKSECDKCPNREMVNDACFEKCPDYAPLVDEDGTCYTCDLEEHISRKRYGTISIYDRVISNRTDRYPMSAIKTSKENCLKCPNRTYQNDLCINKAPTKGIFMADFYTKEYYSCFFEGSLRVSEEECNKCSNRTEIGLLSCVLKECPEERPIQLSDAQCVSCDDPAILPISKEQCDKCPNRMMKGSFCALKECPDDRPMMSDTGLCFSCQTKDPLLVVSAAECKKCPDRHMYGNYCAFLLPPLPGVRENKTYEKVKKEKYKLY